MKITIRALENEKNYIQSCIDESKKVIEFCNNNVQYCLESNRKLNPNYSIEDHQQHIQLYENELDNYVQDIEEIDKAIKVLNEFYNTQNNNK